MFFLLFYFFCFFCFFYFVFFFCFFSFFLCFNLFSVSAEKTTLFLYKPVMLSLFNSFTEIISLSSLVLPDGLLLHVYQFFQRLVHYQQRKLSTKFNLKAFDIWNHYFPKGPYLSEGEKSTTITNLSLPEDVLLEILARLPVKSLLRFRLVSRSWRDIMKEPTFITKHRLSQVSLNDGNCFFGRCSCAKDFGLLEKDEQVVIKFTQLELPFLKNLPKSSLEVAGPCNGIVVISDRRDKLFLWNPATREYKALPPSSQPLSFPDSKITNWVSSSSCVGFGIDPRTKDYKIVRVCQFDLIGNRNFVHKVEVMSLSATNICRPKSETWKIIHAVPPASLLPYGDHIYANGKYYWFAAGKYGLDYRLVWFDMGSEVFGKIKLCNTICCSSCFEKLVVLKGCVMLMRHAFSTVEEENKHMYELLIIDDDGRLTKYATVGPFPFRKPIGLWKNQELITLATSGAPLGCYDLNFYDINTNVIKSKIEGVRAHFCGYSLHFPGYSFDLYNIYNESLISFGG